MAGLRTKRSGAVRKPDTPLRFEVAPGAAVARAGHTVVILDLSGNAHVRVQDVATGAVAAVPIGELTALAGGLSPLQSSTRWDQVRRATRDEWLEARRRERVIRRLVSDEDGSVGDRIARATRTLGLSRTSIYRLIQRYLCAGQTSSLLLGHRGTPQKHRRLPASRERIVTGAINDYFLRRPRAKVSQLTEEIRDRCQRA